MKIFCLVASLLISFAGLGQTKSTSQSFKKLFLGEDYLMYKGLYFVLDPNRSPVTWYAFSEDLEHSIKDIHSDGFISKPDTSHITVDSIENRYLFVENIINDSRTSIDHTFRPIFALRDTISKRLIYYRYDIRNEFNFPFLTSKINYEKQNFCTEMSWSIDDFTGEKRIATPLSSNLKMLNTSMSRHINKGLNTYYLSLHAPGGTATVDGKGAYVLFTDGTKWYRNVKISVDADSDGFQYSAFIPINKSDLVLFSQKKINKIRLYIYDSEIDSHESEKFKAYVNCLQTLKI